LSTALTGDADCNERLVTLPHIAACEFPRHQFRRPLNSVDRSATHRAGGLQVNPPPECVHRILKRFIRPMSGSVMTARGGQFPRLLHTRHGLPVWRQWLKHF
jgi:hypothetical protein